MTIIQKLNKYLQTWKPFNDLYRSFIGDDSKVPNSEITNINDENTGSIANPLMWLSDVSDFLIEQMNINTAEGKWLTRLKRYYGVKRNIGESDIDYRLRLKKVLLSLKETFFKTNALPPSSGYLRSCNVISPAGTRTL